jgi:putative FmdB family regulatory protein
MIYEYKCENCNHEVDIEQKITESPRKNCPECRKDSLKRLISNTSFVLRGEAWEKKKGY